MLFGCLLIGSCLSIYLFVCGLVILLIGSDDIDELGSRVGFVCDATVQAGLVFLPGQRKC